METKPNRLEEIDKTKNPFKVPENYFSQFNEEIMRKLPEKEFVAPQPVTMWEKVKPWVYLAAMFIGMYVMINFLVTKDTDNGYLSQQQKGTTQTLFTSPQSNNYWSTVRITEEEFYQFLEDQVLDDSYYDYMSHQYLN